MTAGHRRTTLFAEKVSGLLVFTSAVVIGYSGTLWGNSFAHGEITNSLFPGALWPVGVVGSVLVTVFGVFASLAIVLGTVESLAEPRLFGRTTLTLAGFGGFVGTLTVVGTSILHWGALIQIPNGIISIGPGDSVLSLAVTALPLGFLFYKLWHPGDTPGWESSRYATEEPPDPEFVRQSRTVHSEEAGPDTPASPTPPQPKSTPPTAQDRNDPPPGVDRIETQDSIQFSDLEYHWETETDVSMDDIGGMAALKEELERDIIKPLTTGKEKAEALGIPLPNIVFHGPPGTGKTFMAKALATELGLPFAQLSGADVQSKWINESATKINTLFEEAKTVAASEGGAVVFLDELDAVLKQRSGTGGSHEEDNKVVAEFLNHLQETSAHDVIFIGATNRLDSLDDAGIRAGRIDKKIHIGKPDHEARKAILRAQLAGRRNELTNEHLDAIAERTEGLVAADLESIIVEAARSSAYERDDDVIQWKDMVRALQRYRS